MPDKHKCLPTCPVFDRDVKAAALVLQRLKRQKFCAGQVIINFTSQGTINLKEIFQLQKKRTSAETNCLTLPPK